MWTPEQMTWTDSSTADGASPLDPGKGRLKKYLDVSPSRDSTPKQTQSLTNRLSGLKWRAWLWAWRYLVVPLASRRIITAKTCVRSRPNTFEICSGRCVTETGCTSSNSVFRFLYNFFSARYSYSSQYYT